MALMMPSPDCSWLSSLIVGPSARAPVVERHDNVSGNVTKCQCPTSVRAFRSRASTGGTAWAGEQADEPGCTLATGTWCSPGSGVPSTAWPLPSPCMPFPCPLHALPDAQPQLYGFPDLGERWPAVQFLSLLWREAGLAVRELHIVGLP